MKNRTDEKWPARENGAGAAGDTSWDLINAYWVFGHWDSITALRVQLESAETMAADTNLKLQVARINQGELSEGLAALEKLACQNETHKAEVVRYLCAGAFSSLSRMAMISGDTAKAEQLCVEALSMTENKTIAPFYARARVLAQDAEELNVADNSKLYYYGAAETSDRNHIESTPESSQSSLNAIAEEIFANQNPSQKLRDVCNSKSLLEEYHANLYISVAKMFKEAGDNLTAMSLFESAIKDVKASSETKAEVVDQMISMGFTNRAIEILFEDQLQLGDVAHLITNDSRLRVERLFFNKNRSRAKPHGQALLIDFISREFNARYSHGAEIGLVMVEIGSTREIVPGQGSTEQLAELCNKFDIHFITVDMDPNNTHAARLTLKKINPSFSAINSKGEDFFEDYAGDIDFVFLDAFDFDHGNHSSFRQSRYETILGTSITDAACHKMHLDCAMSLSEKLSLHGVICMDDTWISDGEWAGKGTSAVPYLLANGFITVAIEYRSVLLRRAD